MGWTAPTRRGRGAAVTAVLVGAVLVAGVVVVPVPAHPTAAAADGFQALAAPQRLLDTRPGEHTADSAWEGGGALAAGDTLELPVAGRVGLPDDPTAVMLNVTVAAPTGPGFVTVYPCGRRPTASTVNYTPGQTVPNAVIATVSAQGTVCFYSYAATHLVVDVSGWFPEGSYRPLAAPQRVLDTRPGQPTADGDGAGTGLRPAMSVTSVPVAGRVGLPDDAESVVVNVTVTEPDAAGFVTVFPCGAEPPNASNVNYTPGATVPNMAVSKVGVGGAVCLYTYAAAHLIVDVSGSLPAATFVPLATPQRLLDTRGGAVSATVDGRFRGWGTQPWHGSLELEVTDRGGVPAEASAVVLNVTAVAPRGAGFVTVHPRGSALPTASNVNYAAGDVVANAVVARVGAGGRVCLYNYAPTDIVVDVAGYLAGPLPAEAGPPCPSTQPTEAGVVDALVRRPGLHAAVGTDRVAVLPCGMGSDYPHVDGAAVADWLNDEVAPWFTEESGGRYTPVFEEHPLGRIDVDRSDPCSWAAAAVTGAPYTNVVTVTEGGSGAGHGSPGRVGFDDVGVLVEPPSVTDRFVSVGNAAAFVDASMFVHEIGHSIHWPHSYLDPDDEYTNPVDVMSRDPDLADEGEPPEYCDGNDGWPVHCWAQHTVAFNRLAAGWLDDRQVAIHRSGATNYTLAAPTAAAARGVQLVAAPDPAHPARILTIEARPAIGRDRFNERAGVAVHLIDQTEPEIVFGYPFEDMVSLDRRQAQAAGEPNSYDHVVAPGESLTVGGVTVTVDADGAGESCRVTVRGTYRGVSLED